MEYSERTGIRYPKPTMTPLSAGLGAQYSDELVGFVVRFTEAAKRGRARSGV
jgi:hypothetical protein